MLYFFLFIYLLLSHLLADFVFQPDWLIAWKYKHWKGVMTHALIVFVTSVLFFWPFLVSFNIWAVGLLLGNAVLHYFMDSTKIKTEDMTHHFARLFFLDQLFHLVILGLVGLGLGYVLQFDAVAMTRFTAYFSGFMPFALYLIIAVMITYVYEIVRFQFGRKRFGVHAVSFDYRKMFVRMMVLSLIFGIGLFLSGYEVAKTLFR